MRARVITARMVMAYIVTANIVATYIDTTKYSYGLYTPCACACAFVRTRTRVRVELACIFIEIWVTLMNFFINELSEKCHERCCARPNHLWGHPKCSLGGPGPHLSGPILLWCRPGRGKPLFWPLGAGIPQQAKTKVAKKAPNLNQRRGWLGGIPKGAWEPRGPWAEPALALGNPLTHNQDKKVH